MVSGAQCADEIVSGAAALKGTETYAWAFHCLRGRQAEIWALNRTQALRLRFWSLGWELRD